jgi:hypothetical protein
MTPDPFEAAERLAPTPDENATVDDWVRHYAATAFAAWATFRKQIGQRGGGLGYLSLIGTSATAAAIALTVPRERVSHRLWELTPEAGALNGEWEEWLTGTLDRLGINPADINDEYVARDFRSPSSAAEVAR